MGKTKFRKVNESKNKNQIKTNKENEWMGKWFLVH